MDPAGTMTKSPLFASHGIADPQFEQNALLKNVSEDISNCRNKLSGSDTSNEIGSRKMLNAFDDPLAF